jgi:hypothetical protein
MNQEEALYRSTPKRRLQTGWPGKDIMYDYLPDFEKDSAIWSR